MSPLTVWRVAMRVIAWVDYEARPRNRVRS